MGLNIGDLATSGPEPGGGYCSNMIGRFRRRLYKQKRTSAARRRNMIPPTIPPIIAPTIRFPDEALALTVDIGLLVTGNVLVNVKVTGELETPVVCPSLAVKGTSEKKVVVKTEVVDDDACVTAGRFLKPVTTEPGMDEVLPPSEFEFPAALPSAPLLTAVAVGIPEVPLTEPVDIDDETVPDTPPSVPRVVVGLELPSTTVLTGGDGGELLVAPPSVL